VRGDAGPHEDAARRGDAGSHGAASARRDAPGPHGGSAPVDAEALRQRWPEILDRVKSEKKVAWILLNTASVQELEHGVLTIAFPSEGNARGFASSGHDQILAGALVAMLGLNVRVRAIADPPASPAASGRAAKDNLVGPPSADPAGSPAAPRPEGGTRGPAAVPEVGRAAQGRAAPGPAAGGQQAKPRRSRPAPPQQDAGSADEEWPDDATGPGAGAEHLTGMELIRRQLGGRVIQEIEDS
jgi:DNA polymerase-3 subunit gamma/tau